MVAMKTAKCPNCGSVVLKLAGKASKLSYDLCLKCREVEREEYKASSSIRRNGPVLREGVGNV